MSENASQILQSIPKTQGAANNIAPNYYDGMMFANDAEFYLYGGLLRDTDSLQPPRSDDVMGYERFQDFGSVRPSWQVGFYEGVLPPGMTRYITAGAGVNVPSENLGFYFSGMRRNDSGEIRAHGRPTYNATTTSNTLVSIDMSTMRAEKWYNTTLPTSVAGRANAELVWVPVAGRGLLVAIGGVINPEWAFAGRANAQKLQSQNTSPGFMKNVSIYDIEHQKWYTQQTNGDTPPQLTQACSVIASAKDGSSHNIYLYGGYDGLESDSKASDDVYILSLPSFTWIKAYTGNAAHGRRAHRCAKVYPDQMMVVGGIPQLDTYDCLDGGLLQVFNLNTLKWQNNYSPETWSEYRVPDLVTAKIHGKVYMIFNVQMLIGNSADGGATTVQPTTWSDNDLSTLFGAKYNGQIKKYYPYPSVNATATSPNSPRNTTVLPTPVPQGGGTPKWIGPVLGVVLGLVFLTAIVAFIVFWRRRKYPKTYGSSEDGTHSNRHRIMNWMQGTPPVAKAATVSTTEDTMDRTTAVTSPTSEKPPEIVEAGGKEVHEMPDTSAATELPTGSMSQVKHSPSSGLRPRAFHPPSTTGTPRPDSPISGVNTPTTSPTAFIPGHRRNMSSMGSSGLPSPESVVTPDGDDEAVQSEKGNPMEALGSPISPADNDRVHSLGDRLSPPPANVQGSGEKVRRQSSFGEVLE
ncbi:MAG: hypothetical protein M1836_006604 [Candelina mexicana]|nr:MAG: hypothetical protein M1836_006604 [Candelina mexicana]